MTSETEAKDMTGASGAVSVQAASQQFILGHITPEPTEQELQAIQQALAAVADRIFPAGKPSAEVNLHWRFSGRWWNRGGLAPAVAVSTGQ